MSLKIVDRRTVSSKDKSTENRARFLRRIKGAVKAQVRKLVKNRSLKDVDSKGGDIMIDRRSINEPHIHHANGGDVDYVLPDNQDYVEGDTIEKGRRGGSQGDGDKSGDDIDGYLQIELTREEFLQYFFEDLELPDLALTELTKLYEIQRHNAGFQTDGAPNRLHILRSYKQSLARRLPRIKLLEELQQYLADVEAGNPTKHPSSLLVDGSIQKMVWPDPAIVDLNQVRETVTYLLEKKEVDPLFDDMDLRYRSSVQRQIPIAHATMIMVMDVSGSMQEKERQIAFKFFWLLYKFLCREYDGRVDTLFCIHTTEAEWVTEDEFFETSRSGGTCVSSALDLVAEKVKELQGKTNIYVAQVSDGDNESTDNGTCYEIIEDDILPASRYFSYVQVDDYHEIDDSNSSRMAPSFFGEKGLWAEYKKLSEANKKLQIRRVVQESDIFPVFRELFEKKV